MIIYTRGNLFTSTAAALVNPVNVVGVMGKGLALEFKKRYPENFEAYKFKCDRGEVKVGTMLVTPLWNGLHKWIINFPTKKHWADPSRLVWITEGLIDLRRIIMEKDIPSIAIPGLGAGLGGLDWESVRSEIEAILGDLETEIQVYTPL